MIIAKLVLIKKQIYRCKLYVAFKTASIFYYLNRSVIIILLQ